MLVIIGAISGIREYLFAKTNPDDNVKPNYRRLFKNRGRFTLLRYHQGLLTAKYLSKLKMARLQKVCCHAQNSKYCLVLACFRAKAFTRTPWGVSDNGKQSLHQVRY